MSMRIVFRVLALAFLAFALLLAYLRFDEFRSGEVTSVLYALNIGGPLLMSVAMQVFARQFGSSDGGDGNA